MVVERFKAGCIDSVYERFAEKGCMLPDGLVYIDSWVNKERCICGQLMETGDKSLFAEWTKIWEDLVGFEIVSID